MGFLHICKGRELLRYGTKNTSGICDCASKTDPSSIYTDGSLNPETGQGGYGVFSEGLKIGVAKSCLYTDHKNSVLGLELKAILEAVIIVKKNLKVRHRVNIFSDSEDALTQLQILQNGQKPFPDDDNKVLGERILKEIKSEEWKIQVHIHKVKAHSGVSGNENADSFAKEGAMKAARIPSFLLPKYSVAKDQVYSFSSSFNSCYCKRTKLSGIPLVENPILCRSPCPYKIPQRSYVSPLPGRW